MSTPAPADDGTCYPVDRYAVRREDGLLVFGFTQDGADGQLLIEMSESLAWQMASKVLAILDIDPATPEDMMNYDL